jgi:hypothetical protein
MFYAPLQANYIVKQEYYPSTNRSDKGQNNSKSNKSSEQSSILRLSDKSSFELNKKRPSLKHLLDRTSKKDEASKFSPYCAKPTTTSKLKVILN